MRIVKLGEDEFKTLSEVRDFFRDEIQNRSPRGKFRVPKGWIASDKLTRDEPLVFTFQAKVVFTALAAGGLEPNDNDDKRNVYPSFFVVDIDTLCAADEDLSEVEQEYNTYANEHVHLVHAHGWNILPDTNHTWAIFTRLRKCGII